MLSGCFKQSVSDITPILSGFSCEFEIENSDLSGEMTVGNDKKLTMNFLTPNEIKGTSISVDDSSVFIETLGITKKYDIEDIPNDSVAVMIYSALKTAYNSTPINEGNEIVINGNIHEYKYSIQLLNTGTLKSIIFDSNATVIKFDSIIKH